MKAKLIVLCAVLATVACAQETTQTQEDISSLVELLRSDIQTEKTAIITRAMKFDEQEASVFWPIYRQYELELAKIIDERLALIKDFAQNYNSMDGEKARTLTQKALDLEEKKVALLKKYHKEFDKKVSPIKAARFVQLENQIGMLIDLKVVSQLPLVK